MSGSCLHYGEGSQGSYCLTSMQCDATKAEVGLSRVCVVSGGGRLSISRASGVRYSYGASNMFYGYLFYFLTSNLDQMCKSAIAKISSNALSVFRSAEGRSVLTVTCDVCFSFLARRMFVGGSQILLYSLISRASVLFCVLVTCDSSRTLAAGCVKEAGRGEVARLVYYFLDFLDDGCYLSL